MIAGVTGERERRQGDKDDGREHWKLERRDSCGGRRVLPLTLIKEVGVERNRQR